MPIPDVATLQFLILTAIGGTERSGRYIREQLEKERFRKSLPAFYQLVSRLEDAKLAVGSTDRIEVEGEPAARTPTRRRSRCSRPTTRRATSRRGSARRASSARRTATPSCRSSSAASVAAPGTRVA